MHSVHDVHEMNAYGDGHISCLSACYNLKTAEWNWMKFDMDIMVLGTTLKLYFTILNIT
jgi:hypothetical protein